MKRLCLRDVAREREKALWSVLNSVHLNVSKATIITAILLLVAFVTSERNNTAAKDEASLAGRLQLYPLEIKYI